MWIPRNNGHHCDVFAYSADYLRIYKMDPYSSTPIVDSILNKVLLLSLCNKVGYHSRPLQSSFFVWLERGQYQYYRGCESRWNLHPVGYHFAASGFKNQSACKGDIWHSLFLPKPWHLSNMWEGRVDPYVWHEVSECPVCGDSLEPMESILSSIKTTVTCQSSVFLGMRSMPRRLPLSRWIRTTFLLWICGKRPWETFT